ncbi:cyclic nucleotide-binding domain-containing protein [Xanthobacter sp. TB0139]|uniref:cyclic nucleotide-binding domain-containing protein n=1 Tax=Xanthobacter sp. TB0139 TaxID=3459178 RepID=UPI00403968EC
MDETFALLRAISTFSVLDGLALGQLACGVEELHVPAGTVLFQAGEAADGGYVVASGAILLQDGAGPSGPFLRTVEPGALIGETALLLETKRPATAVAAEETRLFHVPRALFIKVLESAPQSAQKLRRAMTSRLEETMGALGDVRAELERSRPMPRSSARRPLPRRG